MEFLNPIDTVNINLLDLLRNMALGVVFAVILAVMAGRSRRLVGSMNQYLSLFMMLIPTMILIITVIKSSIALSLGLVGALSIVRFRTPIKEPEELTYIFVAIAVGLGLGANQVLATIIGFVVILIALGPSALISSKSASGNSVYLEIIVECKPGDSFDANLITDILEELNSKYRIKHISDHVNRGEIVIELPKADPSILSRLKQHLEGHFKDMKLSLIDNTRVIT